MKKAEEEKEEEKRTTQPHEPKKVVQFDMFNELPPALIPSEEVTTPITFFPFSFSIHVRTDSLKRSRARLHQSLGRTAGAASAAGEDELNLQDNWDDEEGYYGTAPPNKAFVTYFLL